MANIGTFKKSGHEFQGEIVTLSLQSKGVRFVPETDRASDNAPSHRVYVGRAEIGAAWSKRSNEGRDYLSVKLDDPSFTAPIYANLVEDGDDLQPHLVAEPQAEQRLSRSPPSAPPVHAAGRSLCGAHECLTCRNRPRAPSNGRCFMPECFRLLSPYLFRDFRFVGFAFSWRTWSSGVTNSTGLTPSAVAR